MTRRNQKYLSLSHNAQKMHTRTYLQERKDFEVVLVRLAVLHADVTLQHGKPSRQVHPHSVEAAANVGEPTSLPVLDVVVAANIGQPLA